MGFIHATHEQVFGLASMVDFGQSDMTRTLTQVWDQLARRSPAGLLQQISSGFGPASIMDAEQVQSSAYGAV